MLYDIPSRLARIEEQTRAIQESVKELAILQREQNGTVRKLETEQAVLRDRLDTIYAPKSMPTTTKVTTYSAIFATGATAAIAAIIEYFKK